MATLDELLQEVTDNSNVDDSIITLLVGIKQQLDDVLSNGGTMTAEMQAKIDEIFAVAQADKEKVTAAVIANTTTTTE